MSKKPAEAQRTIIASIPKNNRGEKLRVILGEYQGHHFADVRLTFVGEEGQDIPTKKGVAIPVAKIGEVIDALLAARRQAQDRGWLKSERKAA